MPDVIKGGANMGAWLEIGWEDKVEKRVYITPWIDSRCWYRTAPALITVIKVPTDKLFWEKSDFKPQDPGL